MAIDGYAANELRRWVTASTLARTGFAALLSLAACAESTLTAKDGGGEATRSDAGRRVNPRTVAIDLCRIATRTITQDAEGEPVFGEMQPIEGADVCIVQRRDAYAVFEPFETLEQPICVKSVADQIVRIEDAPASSDLVITIEYDGLDPEVLTSRTGERDVIAPTWTGTSPCLLLEPGAVDPWIVPSPSTGPKDTLINVHMTVFWLGTAPASPEVLRATEAIWGGADGLAQAPSTIRIDPAGSTGPFEVATRGKIGTFVRVPEGSARVQLRNENERLGCISLSRLSGAELSGLVADLDDTIEMPVLAGYGHFAAFMCQCNNGPGDGELLDLATCTFAPSDAGDSDAGSR